MITDIKTRLVSKILQEYDTNKLNHIEYIVNIDEIREKVKDVFLSKNVPVYGYTYEHTVNNLIAEVKVDLTTKIQFLEDIKQGKAFDTTRFMIESLEKPVDIRSYMNIDMNIDHVMNFIADDWSCAAVGKGEYFFTVFLNGATKPNGPGDIHLGKNKVELKGKEARLCSTTTHASPASIRTNVHAALERFSNRQYTSLPVFGKENVAKFYDKAFSDKKTYIQFVKYTFNKLAYKATPDNFEFVDDCISDEHVLNWEKWKYHQAIFEYEYYKKHENHDMILFLHPEKMKALLTRNVSDIKNNYSNFSLKAKYNWNGEHGKTMFWSLK